jgi:uncharacterized protein YegP (UPF0339 family)
MVRVARALMLSLGLVAVAGLVGPPFVAGQAKKDKDKTTKAVAGTSVFEIHKGKNDKFYFSMRDSEGVLLATSGKGYETKIDCQKVIQTIRDTAAKAKVEDLDAADKKAVDKKTDDKKTVDKKSDDKKKKK